MGARLTDLVASLPATVPFVGPETQERRRGAPFAARIGANESIFGPSPADLRRVQESYGIDLDLPQPDPDPTPEQSTLRTLRAPERARQGT